MARELLSVIYNNQAWVVVPESCTEINVIKDGKAYKFFIADEETNKEKGE